ncbi:MAG: Rib/alpha-like domain-containing protein [Pseudomonadota bacterium]
MTFINQPFVTALDDNGDPHSFALMKPYAAGSTTPLDTYREKELQNKHPWPVEADEGGRFPQIFLQAFAYDLRLETANGAHIRTDEDVQATGAGLAQNVVDALLLAGSRLDALYLAVGDEVTYASKVGQVIGADDLIWLTDNGATYAVKANLRPYTVPATLNPDDLLTVATGGGVSTQDFADLVQTVATQGQTDFDRHVAQAGHITALTSRVVALETNAVTPVTGVLVQQSPLPTRTVQMGQSYSDVNVKAFYEEAGATDTDYSGHTFTLSGAPEGVTIGSTTGRITVAPSTGQTAGDYSATVTVDGGSVGTLSMSILFTLLSEAGTTPSPPPPPAPAPGISAPIWNAFMGSGVLP